MAWRSSVDTELSQTALAVTASALVPWLVTSFGRLRSLGESERYLEFAAPAAWLLLLWLQPIGLSLVIALGLTFLAFYGATLAFMARADSCSTTATCRRSRRR